MKSLLTIVQTVEWACDADVIEEPEPAQRVIGGAGWNHVRPTAARPNVVCCDLEVFACRRDSSLLDFDRGAENTAQQDVPDAFVLAARPGHPALEHEHAAQSGTGRSAAISWTKMPSRRMKMPFTVMART